MHRLGPFAIIAESLGYILVVLSIKSRKIVPLTGL